jgi:DNA-binding MarR family transcriptional regulator
VTETQTAPRIFYYFLKNYNKISFILESILKPEGLTAGQYTALSFLKRFEPCTAAELARHQNITAQSMGEYLSALENKGFVEREYLNGNRRNIMVRRSPAGIEVQARCDAIVLQAEQAYLSPIPPEDVDRLVRQLTQLFHSRENE